MFWSILELPIDIFKDILLAIQSKFGLIKFADYLPEKIVCQVTDVTNFSASGCFYMEGEIVSPTSLSTQKVTIDPSTLCLFPHRGIADTSYNKIFSMEGDYKDEDFKKEYPAYMHRGNPYGLVQKSRISLIVSEKEMEDLIEKTRNLDALMSNFLAENENRPAKLFIEITIGEVFWDHKVYKQQYVKDYRLISEYKSSEKVSSQIIN